MARKKINVKQSLIDFPSEKMAEKPTENTNDAPKKIKQQEASNLATLPLGMLLPRKKKDIRKYFKPKKEEAEPFNFLRAYHGDYRDKSKQDGNEQMDLIEELRKAKDNRIVAVDALLKHMAHMDIEGVGSLLPDDFKDLGGNSKAVFLINLEDSFSLLRGTEVTVLKVYNGICNYCYSMKRGFAFLEPSSGFYLSLIIETKNGYISNIYNCNEIKFEPSVHLNPSKRLDVKEI